MAMVKESQSSPIYVSGLSAKPFPRHEVGISARRTKYMHGSSEIPLILEVG